MNKILKIFIICIFVSILPISIFIILSIKLTEDFIESPIFTGKKNGYVFKKGNKGTGYYKDN